jgi:MFS family permease
LNGKCYLNISKVFIDNEFRALFKDVKFVTLFLAGAVATFPLFVPPFFLPLYSNSLGLSASAGAGLVAGFNFSSAVGRLCCGFLSDWYVSGEHFSFCSGMF